MASSDLTLDDIHSSIADLATSISDMASMTGTMLAATEERLTIRMDRGFREVNERLENLEDASETYRNDIEVMYRLLTNLQRDVRELTQSERQRLAELEAFAMQVAEKKPASHLTPSPSVSRSTNVYM